MPYTKEPLASINTGQRATFGAARFGSAKFGKQFNDDWQRVALNTASHTKEALQTASHTKEALQTP